MGKIKTYEPKNPKEQDSIWNKIKKIEMKELNSNDKVEFCGNCGQTMFIKKDAIFYKGGMLLCTRCYQTI